MAGTLKVDQIKSLNGATTLTLDKFSSTGRYTRQTVRENDTTNYSSTTAWALASTFSVISGCQGNSLIKLFYSVPTRNNSTSWGGGYIEPQVRFNGGTWESLGSCGHDAAVMYLGNQFIGTYNQTILIDPGLSSEFSVQFRLYFSSYDGTIGLNNALGHATNTVSGTAPVIPGANGLQHYIHIIVEEIARYS